MNRTFIKYILAKVHVLHICNSIGTRPKPAEQANLLIMRSFDDGYGSSAKANLMVCVV